MLNKSVISLEIKHIQRRRHQSHETGDHSQTLILIDKAIVSGESIWNPRDFSILLPWGLCQ
jgi:hypothetical protein